MINKITQKVILPKTEKLVWSDDIVITMDDALITFSVNYIYEEPIDIDDPVFGIKEGRKEYDYHLLKSKIESVEWAYDIEDDCYLFKICAGYSNIEFGTENKKQAIEQCNKILNWLLS